MLNFTKLREQQMDYFNIKQDYYTGNFKHCLQEINSLPELDNTGLYYKLKCQFALGESFNNADLATKFGKIFQQYVQSLQESPVSGSNLQSLIDMNDTDAFELNLLATLHGIEGNFDESLKTCVHAIDNLENTDGMVELVLLAVQIALLNKQPQVAQTIYENFVSLKDDQLTSETELVINLMESYIKFATNVDTMSSNFYYFEEMAQTYSTWKTQLNLLNLHLQQGNLVEANDIINILESDYYSKEQLESASLYKSDFLASKITLAVLEGKNIVTINELKDELKNANSSHPLIKNDLEINGKFDEIVVKYNA